jgi:hypothetical protein
MRYDFNNLDRYDFDNLDRNYIATSKGLEKPMSG